MARGRIIGSLQNARFFLLGLELVEILNILSYLEGPFLFDALDSMLELLFIGVEIVLFGRVLGF